MSSCLLLTFPLSVSLASSHLCFSVFQTCNYARLLIEATQVFKEAVQSQPK